MITTHEAILCGCNQVHVCMRTVSQLQNEIDKLNQQNLVLIGALEKITMVQLDPSLGQIVDCEHYEKCWYDCRDIAEEALKND